MKTRQQIVNEAKRALREIDQIFDDAYYWNNNVRKPHGMADQMDRLRAIGNGQNPGVAAVAWKCLSN
jgi:hypothetical protein